MAIEEIDKQMRETVSGSEAFQVTGDWTLTSESWTLLSNPWVLAAHRDSP